MSSVRESCTVTSTPMPIRLPTHLTSLLLGFARTANGEVGTVAEVDANADMGAGVGSASRAAPVRRGRTNALFSLKNFFQAEPGEACELSAGQALCDLREPLLSTRIREKGVGEGEQVSRTHAE